MNRVAKRAWSVVLIAVLLLTGTGFFTVEYFMNAPAWAVFPGSPHVYNAGNMGTGVITDRSGVLLLNMRERYAYSTSPEIRMSALHWVGDRNGNISAPAVPHYSNELVGFDLLNGLYSFGGAGDVAKLTLSAQAQVAALEAMAGRKGTVAVYNYKTGEILCSVTTPTYDPDNVPDIQNDTTGAYEGAYMNRFTQSAYTPGSIFKVVTLGAALENIPGIEEMEFTCNGILEYGPDSITCESAHGKQSLKQAFCNSCNCAFAQVAELLGAQKLGEFVSKCGVLDSVRFDGIATVRGNFEKSEDAVSLGWSAIGQYKDLVNPCAFMTLMGAIANDGQGAIPYVVGSAGDYRAQTRYTGQVMDAKTAQTIRSYMAYTVENKYGAENFPGLQVCAKTGTAEMDGDKASNAMFCGFVTDEKYPLAFIVCVEEGGYGRATCVPIAAAVLQVCKTVLDGR